MTLRFLVLFRLIAFIGVLYMALHILVARFSRKPESRLLWFFEVLTGPLTRTVSRVVAPRDAARAPALARLRRLRADLGGDDRRRREPRRPPLSAAWRSL